MNHNEVWRGRLALAVAVAVLSVPSTLVAGSSADAASVNAEGTANSSAYWSQFGYDAGRSGFNRAEHILGVANVASLEPAWTAKVQLANESNTSATVTNAVYVPTAGAGIEKLSLETGAVLWSTGSGGRSPLRWPGAWSSSAT